MSIWGEVAVVDVRDVEGGDRIRDRQGQWMLVAQITLDKYDEYHFASVDGRVLIHGSSKKIECIRARAR